MRQFTHDEIMEEYRKICFRVGYTPEEMNCFLHSTIFPQWAAEDFANAMREHYHEMKKRPCGKKITSETVRQIVCYASKCIDEQVWKENKTMRDTQIAKELSKIDINLDYLKN